MLTYSQKKYLFAIYKLSSKGKEVKSSDVAKIVGVSKASTVSMTQKLSEEGYIKKEYYGQIELTETGKKEAYMLFMKCNAIHNFLINSLATDEKTADSDSVAIVTHISEDTAERFIEYLTAI